MRHISRWMGVGFFALASVGCATAQFPGGPTAGDLARELTPPAAVRSQIGEEQSEPVMVAQATPPSAPPTTSSGAIPIPPAPPPNSGGPRQASARGDRAGRAAVRAWVNGRPIFEDEILLELEMRNPGLVREGGDVLTKAYNQTLTSIIEIEIAYQDAVKKLEKGNPTALRKIKEAVDAEYEKQSRAIRKMLPDDKFQEIAPTFRRQLERQYIGMEYIRSRIFGEVNSVGYWQIYDYYTTHLNEFQKVESVKWQHVFIAVNSQRPSLTDARQLGETLLKQVEAGMDFTELAKYDDGDAKSRNSAGFGSRKGEIQPAEVEKYLFEMKNGQLGPVVEVSTGVHLFRLVERDPGGQIPLNDTVQAQIKNKIKNQIFEKEFKRFVRDLKSRAVVEIERGI